jgi:hypothetical protein
VAASAIGCDDSGGNAATGGTGSGTGGTSSGTGGTGSGTGGTVSTGEGVALPPDATGWVDKGMNMAGVQGAWYAYGDGAENGVPPGSCQKAGHMTSECSVITMPAAGMFANVGGKMCTSGTVAKVINLVGGTMPDWSNIWGAGIGLDLNNSGGATAVKEEFDASAYKGISFDIDTPPLAGLRVEFPSKATEGTAAGADFWGATKDYGNSPVVAGTNVITWDAIKGPTATPHTFDKAHILSIQFHVPASDKASAMFSYCISNLKLLK